MEPRMKTHIRSLLGTILRSPAPVVVGDRVLAGGGNASHSPDHLGRALHHLGKNSKPLPTWSSRNALSKPCLEREASTKNFLKLQMRRASRVLSPQVVPPPQHSTVVSHIPYVVRLSSGGRQRKLYPKTLGHVGLGGLRFQTNLE